MRLLELTMSTGVEAYIDLPEQGGNAIVDSKALPIAWLNVLM
jgi:hypothetical protein